MLKKSFCAFAVLAVLLGASAFGGAPGSENESTKLSWQERGDSCGLCCTDECEFTLFPDYGRLRINGWLDGGFLLNGDKPPSRYHGPYNQIDRHEGSLNQLYLIAERELICDCGIDFGGRVDFLYGTDFFLAESRGVEKNPDGTNAWNGDYYGLAVPQAYAEMGNRRLSMKLGHFYTIVGYEGVPATANFFYSKSYSYMFAGPFTHWGGLVTWNVGPQFSVDAGIVNGWDTLDRVNDDAAFLGRVTATDPCDAWSLSFSIITGDEDTPNLVASQNQTRYSLIASLRLAERLEYVFHHWLGVQEDAFASGVSSEWYGIDQYLYYDLTCNLRAGMRLEWFRDDDGVRLGLSRPNNPNKGPYIGNLYSLSMGLNWQPQANVTFRPEVRWDWFDGAGLPFDDGRDDSQFLLGMDAILIF